MSYELERADINIHAIKDIGKQQMLLLWLSSSRMFNRRKGTLAQDSQLFHQQFDQRQLEERRSFKDVFEMCQVSQENT